MKKKATTKMFFSFANTVATIDFAKKFKGHGWMGIRFLSSILFKVWNIFKII